MKKIAILLFLTIFTSIILFTACIQSPWRGQVIENALIERIFSNMIHIQVTFDDGRIQHYNINICDDIYWQGEKISLSDLHVGDRVRVTYDGAKIELYPALIEGTTKIELLGDAISPPTTEFRAEVTLVETSTSTITVIGRSAEGYEDRQFTFALSDDIRYVKDHRVIDKATIRVGDIIFVTHQGHITDGFHVIRVEIHESRGGTP